MPMYAYKCTSCEHEFECLKKHSDRLSVCESPCPNCNSDGSVQCNEFGTPNLVFGARKKPSSAFQDKINRMKKAYDKAGIKTSLKDY